VPGPLAPESGEEKHEWHFHVRQAASTGGLCCADLRTFVVALAALRVGLEPHRRGRIWALPGRADCVGDDRRHSRCENLAAAHGALAGGLAVVVGGARSADSHVGDRQLPDRSHGRAGAERGPACRLARHLCHFRPALVGAGEEPGWRGYAVHRLEMGRSRLWALLPLWIIIVVWHIPLFLTGDAEWVDILNMVGGVIIYNWLYHRSGHSVLLVMVIHAMNNAASGEFFSPMFTGVYSVQQAWMRTLVWGVVAAIVLVANWRWWTQTEEHQIEEPRPVLKAA
jgi:hypothetical protein